MAATTTLLGLVTPTQGTLSGTWGDTVNYGITDYVDISVAGTLTLTGDGAVTLANTTGSSSGNSITSTLAGAGTVTAQFSAVRVSGTTTTKVVTGPSYSKTYLLDNASSFAVTFKASGQTGVSISPGEKVYVYYNATDYVKVGGGGITYGAVKTTTYTAVSNDGVQTSTSGGAFTVNLPATPATGTQVFIVDSAGTWGTNNLTIGRNGSTIAGSATDLVCDINSVSIQCIYDGTTWDIFAQIGANDTAVLTQTNTVTGITNKTFVAPVLGAATATSLQGIIGNVAPAAGSFTTLGASSTATLNTLASSGATLTGGTINGMTIGATTASTGAFTGVNTPNTFGFKNRIINGEIDIDQRNAGASYTQVNGQYSLDRWSGNSFDGGAAANKFSVIQSSTAPTGFSNSLLVTSLAATASSASNIFNIEQKIEGFNFADFLYGTASAQTLTLSFWVRSSLTGTFGGALKNSARNRAYPFTYTISTANTFEQKTITITGDTSGTWVGGTNGVGLWISFGLGVGSTYSGTAGAWGAGDLFSATSAVSVVGTNGATFYLTGVQLEKGSTATSFDVRPFSTELTLCQRYFEKSYNVDTAPGAASNYQGTAKIQGVSDTSSNASVTVSFKVPKRTTATMTFYNAGSGASGTWEYTRSGAGAYVTANADQPSYGGVNVYGAVGGSGYLPVVWFGHWLASAEL